MTEREFYISIVPEISELIVLLRDVSSEDREEIKREMLNNCKARPQAFRFMKKLWIGIDTQLQAMHAN
jgi:hypothetical protein|nr:MAG TPA: hypothetical protein [Caudoviricetes sp.]DAJ55965.1 MAG TPA: hypothetical protein [Caudoviricetes sp.]